MSRIEFRVCRVLSSVYALFTQLYGEPDPGKIPTGTMTTFTASKKHVGKDKSQTCQMSCKVDGYTWHGQYTTKMKEHYGARFEAKDPSRAR